METRTWCVDVYLDEDEDGRTRAEAVLRTRAGAELARISTAYARPVTCHTQKDSEEFSACRALSAIAHDLLDATVVDVRQHHPASDGPG